jgi:hypothetical protein
MRIRKTKVVRKKQGNARERKTTREVEIPETTQEEAVPAEIDLPPNPTRDLPPNENIRKHPDEVYGDTLIPHRKPR